MSDKQVCAIMAAIIYNRLFELERVSHETAIKEATKVALDLMDASAKAHGGVK